MANCRGGFEEFDRVRRLAIDFVPTPAGAESARARDGGQSHFAKPQRQRFDLVDIARRLG